MALPVRTWTWKPHKAITIEITKEPGHGPHVDLCAQGAVTIEELDRVIEELTAARREAVALGIVPVDTVKDGGAVPSGDG